MPPPGYFPLNVAMNKGGYESIDDVMARGTRALSPDAFEAAANETSAVVLDVRPTAEFIERHVPRSTFIGLQGGFAPWVGAVIVDVKQPILLIANDDQIEEAITRSFACRVRQRPRPPRRGVDAWVAAGKETDHIETVDAEAFEHVLANHPDTCVVDVRKDGEFSASHVEGAAHASWNSWATTSNASPRTPCSTSIVPEGTGASSHTPCSRPADTTTASTCWVDSKPSKPLHPHHRFCLPEHVEVS